VGVCGVSYFVTGSIW